MSDNNPQPQEEEMEVVGVDLILLPLSPESRELFPLKTIAGLERLFDLEVINCQGGGEPNLAIISIILGAIECSLVYLEYKRGVKGPTTSAVINKKKRGHKGRRPSVNVEYREAVQDEEEGGIKGEDPSQNNNNNNEKKEGDFPPLELEVVESLYLKFQDILRTYVEIPPEKNGLSPFETPKELVKRVSDVIWSYLSKSYKQDMPHIRSLYTYLTGKKLDCLGVSLTVTAACQALGLKDVHLMLSEDHSWVGFGGVGVDGRPHSTAEVTWHGKGIEDKRGQEVGLGDEEDSWLYLKGNGVFCSRHMEVAVAVAAMNPAINATMCSLELVKIQQKLLWMLYDAGHLKKYPMGLITLAELSQAFPNPTPGKPDHSTLYQEAVLSTRTFYGDMHIYPYTTYAAYCFRNEDYKTALKYWAMASRIVQKYRKGKNDEEIYREFLDISTDALTTVMKSCSGGFSANTVNRDPMCFAQLLRFFDGICTWEERSRMGIVHITWAQAWISAIGKFDYTIRRMVKLSEGDVKLEKAVMDEDLEKDSGIDDEDDSHPSPCVTLFSKKLRQIKDFFKLERFKPGDITLILTAQTALDGDNTKTNNGPVGRPRRAAAIKTKENGGYGFALGGGTVNGEDKDLSSSSTSSGPSRKRMKIA